MLYITNPWINQTTGFDSLQIHLVCGELVLKVVVLVEILSSLACLSLPGALAQQWGIGTGLFVEWAGGGGNSERILLFPFQLAIG